VNIPIYWHFRNIHDCVGLLLGRPLLGCTDNRLSVYDDIFQADNHSSFHSDVKPTPSIGHFTLNLDYDQQIFSTLLTSYLQYDTNHMNMNDSMTPSLGTSVSFGGSCALRLNSCWRILTEFQCSLLGMISL
jgi:hypothetical protein